MQRAVTWSLVIHSEVARQPETPEPKKQHIVGLPMCIDNTYMVKTTINGKNLFYTISIQISRHVHFDVALSLRGRRGCVKIKF